MKSYNWKFIPVLLSGLFILSACGGGTPGTRSGFEGVGNDGVRQISFESISQANMNLLGGGGVETSVVTFKVSNSNGTGLSKEVVDFSVSSNIGGVTLLGDVSGASTNTAGFVSITLKSGTVPTSVRVIAKHRSSGVEASSNAVNISSGIPSANSISIAASPSWAVESTLDMNNIAVTLTITAADALGNPAMDGIRFSFLSPEWGTFDNPSCLIVAGGCSVTWLSAFFPEELVGNYATILAYTDGSESFVDANGNNIFDDGEAWTDLGEPFVDTNDNGVWEAGEPWVDANNNGLYDVNGNGVWDGPCPEGDQFTCGTSSTVPIAVDGALLLCATGDCI